MSDHWLYIAAAYGAAAVTLGVVTLRIVLDYRRLRAALARFGAAGARDQGDGA
ncbi:heme exporter protein CcmD [Methylocystis sp.]|uniref:heme exporter protein CcmD n=1 Tax=Methylocystis sp. TaxID=1911079 RepID=UPI0025DE161E|nr:heme exporter protein CcmD [Methylocystis sp.]